jgi:hypothetical protein
VLDFRFERYMHMATRYWLVSEEMQAAREIDGVRILNPHGSRYALLGTRFYLPTLATFTPCELAA